ncbi:MAG: hypothetical protein QM791_05510 [Ferruginibacter sp.]
MKKILAYLANRKTHKLFKFFNTGKQLDPAPSFWALIPLKVEDSFKRRERQDNPD